MASSEGKYFAIAYSPTDSGDYVFGHDGQNDPALNAAVRINPDNADAFIALVSGGEPLATSLGYKWVLWQTGRPDILHFSSVIRNVIPTVLIGCVVIVLLAIIAVWRRRRRLRKNS